MSAAEDVQAPGADPQIRELLLWTGRIGYWILWPVVITLYYALYSVAFALLFVLKLLYRPLEFVALPLIYLARFLYACLLAPFQFLARFETLYIYLGIGALVGGGLGLLLAFIYGSLQEPLGLKHQPHGPGRTAKQYRQEKRRQKAKDEAPLLSPSPGYLSPGHLSLSDGSRKRGRGRDVLSSAIMEEVDSDY